jgi:hypothetical protein
MDTELRIPEEVEGPVVRGERLGTLLVMIDGSEAGAAPLVASRSADAASFGEKLRSRVLDPGALVVLGAVVILIGVALALRGRAGEPRKPDERTRGREERMQRRDRQRL